MFEFLVGAPKSACGSYRFMFFLFPCLLYAFSHHAAHTKVLALLWKVFLNVGFRFFGKHLNAVLNPVFAYVRTCFYQCPRRAYWHFTQKRFISALATRSPRMKKLTVKPAGFFPLRCNLRQRFCRNQAKRKCHAQILSRSCFIFRRYFLQLIPIVGKTRNSAKHSSTLYSSIPEQ